MSTFRGLRASVQILLAATFVACSDSPVDQASCGTGTSGGSSGSSTEYFAVPLTPGVYLINFLFLYSSHPENAAYMPAYSAPLPPEVATCLKENPTGCPWAEYEKYFDIQDAQGDGRTYCECAWAADCQIPSYQDLSPTRYQAPDQINQPLGMARADEMARLLGIDASMIMTEEEYHCLIGTPPRTKDQTTIFECLADLTDSIGNAEIPLSSYGLDISPEGNLRSDCAPDAPCLEFNALLAGPLEKMLFDCGAGEKFLKLVARTPFVEFAKYGNGCQSNAKPSCIVEAQCSRTSGP